MKKMPQRLNKKRASVQNDQICSIIHLFDIFHFRSLLSKSFLEFLFLCNESLVN